MTKIVFFGTPDFVVPILKTLNEKFDVVAVVTTPDQPVGRKQIVTPSPVKEFALANNIPVLQPETLDANFNSQLSILNCQLFVVASYGKIIPQEVLDIPKFGSLNVHPSPLPLLRGASPIQSTILSGQAKSAVSIIKMDEQMDHGPIVDLYPFDISQSDTFQTLAQKTFALAAEKLPKTIEKFVAGEITPQEQNHDKATFCERVKKEDGFIDFTKPPSAETIDRMIRAYYPWPGVWGKMRFKTQDSRFKILPGKIIQVEGGKPMSLKEFGNGYPELKEKVEKLFVRS